MWGSGRRGPARRGPARQGRGALGRAGAAALLGSLALTGCSAVSTLTSSPTITEVTPTPDEITPTTTLTAPVRPGTEGAAATTPATTTPAPTSAAPRPGPLKATERLVTVEELGIAFAAPAGFTDINPKEDLREAVEGGEIQDLAEAYGVSPEQLRAALEDQTQRMLVGSTTGDYQTSVRAARSPTPDFPSDEALRAQLEAGLPFGKVETLRRVETAAGPAVLAGYTLTLDALKIYGQLVFVDAPAELAWVTISSGSAAEVATLTERVLKTIRPIG